MYALARKLLFAVDPEIAHTLSLKSLACAERSGMLGKIVGQPIEDPINIMGIRFPNRVGLAAGLDKNGDYYNALGTLGFGFVEIGTVTPKPQVGNDKPRLFRLPEDGAIINRMGFNNKGIVHLLEQVKQRRYAGVLGINIGKNKTTAEAQAVEDYLLCLEEVYPYADYITINISSPNTPGLRNLQYGEALDQLLDALIIKRAQLQQNQGRYVPLAVKIAPDMTETETVQVAQALLSHKVDGVIATNTSLHREGLKSVYQEEVGGLSGCPINRRSTAMIALLAGELSGKIPIIGVGGIFSAEDAMAKIHAGASLVQIYTGLIYQGPRLVKETARALWLAGGPRG